MKSGFDSLFAEYEQDFGDVSLDISKSIFKIPSLGGEEKKALINETSKKLREAENIVQQMVAEISSLPKTQAAELQPRLKEHQANLAALQKDFKECKFAAPKNAREELMGDYDVELASTSADHRERLLSGTERLKKNREDIERIERIANDTVNQGGEIMVHLVNDREKITRMGTHVRGINDNISKGGRLIRFMQTRTVATKLIIAAIIVLLILAISLVAYLKLKPDTPPDTVNDVPPSASPSLSFSASVSLSAPAPPPPPPPPSTGGSA